VLELIERAWVAPSTIEPGHAVPVEASPTPTKELKLEKTTDQLKVLSPPGTIGLPKPSSVPAVTPRIIVAEPPELFQLKCLSPALQA
jgi:hypothetical protein